MNASKARHFSVAFALVLALSLPAACVAQSKLEGIVTIDGQPGEGVEIVLMRDGTAATISTFTTTKNGRYSFKPMAQSPLALQFNYKNRRIVLVRGLPPQADHSINPVIISYAAQKKDEASLMSTAEDVYWAYRRIGNINRPIPAWTTEGVKWMVTAARENPDLKPGSLKHFNDLTSYLAWVRKESWTLPTQEKDPPMIVAYSPPNPAAGARTRLAIWRKDDIELYEVSGAELAKMDVIHATKPGKGNPRFVFDFAGDKSLVYSPDVVYKHDQVTWVKVPHDKGTKKTFFMSGKTRPLAIAPSGQLIASLDETHTGVEIDSMASEAGRAKFNAGPEAILVGRFSSDGQLFAMGTALGRVKIWDVRIRKIVVDHQLEDASFVTALAFFDKDQRLAVGTGIVDSGKVWLLDQSRGWKPINSKAMPEAATDVVDIRVAPRGDSVIAIRGGGAKPVYIPMYSGREFGTPQVIAQPGFPLYADETNVGILAQEQGRLKVIPFVSKK